MRIAVIGLRGLPGVIGGIETHCERLYPDLAKLSPDAKLFLIARRRYTPSGGFDFKGVRVTSLWAPRGMGSEAALHTLFAILYARIRLNAHLVHLHGIGPAFFAPLSRLLGMRTIVTHHAADFARPKWGLVARAFLMAGEVIAARFADRVICVSDALRDEFLERHPNAAAQTVTIRHGAPRSEHDAAAGERVLAELGLEVGRYSLAVGRLDATKRFHDLVEAMERAATDAPPLVIVGSAVEDSNYAKSLLAKRHPRVIFAGYRNGGELEALYRSAGLFIQPSEMEGFGLVVLEALIAGSRVALSDIPAHREFALAESAYFAVGDIRHMADVLSGPLGRQGDKVDIATLRTRYSSDSSAAEHALLYAQLDGSNAAPTAARSPPC
ncbi:glycosyltransferase family 4 protein [Caulobacter hibisci]|uniref:Glycosyltransferase family 4 protein n=1 Tax=Caulobacter hibisci TaxID=2035993 RepID=A0ABS0T5N5_9CAUL|nr:glycosyltransferase family 4 protein [Caulobacter hibisci]MBI1686415.1 glycosyltransferase family 4 protein [Caulobacter hibisci]